MVTLGAAFGLPPPRARARGVTISASAPMATTGTWCLKEVFLTAFSSWLEGRGCDLDFGFDPHPLIGRGSRRPDPRTSVRALVVAQEERQARRGWRSSSSLSN